MDPTAFLEDTHPTLPLIGGQTQPGKAIRKFHLLHLILESCTTAVTGANMECFGIRQK